MKSHSSYRALTQVVISFLLADSSFAAQRPDLCFFEMLGPDKVKELAEHLKMAVIEKRLTTQGDKPQYFTTKLSPKLRRELDDMATRTGHSHRQFIEKSISTLLELTRQTGFLDSYQPVEDVSHFSNFELHDELKKRIADTRQLSAGDAIVMVRIPKSEVAKFRALVDETGRYQQQIGQITFEFFVQVLKSNLAGAHYIKSYFKAIKTVPRSVPREAVTIRITPEFRATLEALYSKYKLSEVDFVLAAIQFANDSWHQTPLQTL